MADFLLRNETTNPKKCRPVVARTAKAKEMNQNNNTTTGRYNNLKPEQIEEMVRARVAKAEKNLFGYVGPGPEHAKIIIISASIPEAETVQGLFPDACCIGLNDLSIKDVAMRLKREMGTIDAVIVCQDNTPAGENMVGTFHHALGDKVHRIVWGPDDPPGIDINGLLQAGQVNRVREMIDSAVRVPQSSGGCKFKLQKLGDIKTNLPDWLIKGLIEKDTVSVIFGDPESGKSFIAIDIACHVATDTPYHGRRIKTGPVIYIAGEGQNGLKRRFDAWGIRHNKSLVDVPIYLSLQPAAMVDTKQVDTVKQSIDVIIATEGKPSLIVIDTLTRNFGPGDQNTSKDMTAFISGVDAIRAEYGAALIIVHHSGHGDKSRGKGAIDLKGALDTEYRAEKDDTGTVRVKCTKMKDHQKPKPFSLKFRTVELGAVDADGELITSAILDPVEYIPPEQKGPKNLGKWQTVCQDVLMGLFDKHRRNLEEGNFDPNKAKVLISDVKEKAILQGVPSKHWSRYFNYLSELDSVNVNQPYFEMAPHFTPNSPNG